LVVRRYMPINFACTTKYVNTKYAYACAHNLGGRFTPSEP
jgi:hypothetical protein